MNWRVVLKLTAAVIVAALVYFSGTLDASQKTTWALAFAAVAATITYVLDTVIELIEVHRKQTKKKDVIRGYIKRFSSFLSKFTDYKLNKDALLDKILKSDIDYNRQDALYQLAIDEIAGLNELEKDKLLLVSLLYEYDNCGDALKANEYKSSIASIFEQYDFLELDESAKELAKAYKNYSENKKLNHVVTDVDYNQVVGKLTGTYSKSYNLSLQLKLEKDQAQEFRSTLSTLINRGKLSVKQVQDNLQNKIDAAINKKTESSRAFLVLTMKYQNIPEIKEALNKFPNIVFPYKTPYRLPENLKYLHTRIIYPPPNIQSAQNYLDQEIRPLIPEDKLDSGFIAIIPIEGTELYTIPDKDDRFKQSYMQEGFASLTAYKTGVSLNLAEIYLESLSQEMNIDEILSSIPFNIFVPKMSSAAKTLIINYYDRLKTTFSISRLADWSYISPEDLGTELIAIDAEDKRERKKDRRTYTDDNWREWAAKIVKEADKHREALDS